MTPPCLVLILCISVALVPPFTAAASGTAGRPFVSVIGAGEIARLRTDPSLTYERVARYFRAGHPARIFRPGACIVLVPSIGLRFEFESLDARPQETPSHCVFSEARVVGRRWHTQDGLKIGQLVRLLRQAFPHAYSLGRTRKPRWGVPQGATEWTLTPGRGSAAHTELIAFTRNTHVIALGVTVVGH